MVECATYQYEVSIRSANGRLLGEAYTMWALASAHPGLGGLVLPVAPAPGEVRAPKNFEVVVVLAVLFVLREVYETYRDQANDE